MIPCPACELVAAPLFGGFCPNNNCPRNLTNNPVFDRLFMLAHPYSLLSWAQGYTLYQSAKRAPLGAFVELGVYRGGSALMLHLSDPSRELHLFDTFEGHPPLHDARHDRPGSHQAGTLGDTNAGAVQRLLVEHGADPVLTHCWIGTFPSSFETISTGFDAMGFPIALVHVDVDLWRSATDALYVFGKQLVPGGILVMDDYGTDECPGVWEAVEEFVCTHEGGYVVDRSGYPTYQAVLTKVVVE